jgi:hypothetical protein
MVKNLVKTVSLKRFKNSILCLITRGLVRKQVNVDEHDPLECRGTVDPQQGCPQPRFEATGAAVMLAFSIHDTVDLECYTHTPSSVNGL